VKPALAVTLAAVLSAAFAGLWFGREVWLGMLGPLAVAGATWTMTERVYRTAPERLTQMMIGAFAAKLVFFGVYVGLAIGVLGMEPAPFAVSFTAYFIVLHLVEALWLKRLLVS
jgi:hypothetical protein